MPAPIPTSRPARRSGPLARSVALAIGCLSGVAGWPARPVAAPVLVVTAAFRTVQPGELVVLTATAATAPTGALRVHAFDHDALPWNVDARTWRVLVGIDLDVKPGRYPILFDTTVAGAPAHVAHVLEVTAKAFPTRSLTVDDAFVNPPATESARITREAAELERLWATWSPARLWHEPFLPPVAEPANSAFGSRSVFNGQARSPHTGADFLSPAGTPVKSPNAGRVVLAGPLYYTGNTVILDHGLGLYSLFAHFSEIDVHEGDVVTTGQILGKVGATGRVTGPHLHWAVRVNGARVDPVSLLAVLGPAAAGPDHFK
jgi:murein DD-endopeptidase MepM/ murein hydrolase activator NlpD